MLTFPRLGRVGRLGNQLFQVAFLSSFSTRYSVEYRIPPWNYSKYFNHQFSISQDLEKIDYFLTTREPGLGWHESYFVDLVPTIRDRAVNIETGYFQSYKYFDKQHARSIFEFKNAAKPISGGDAIAITVRRGDFVRHPYYHNIDAPVFIELLDRHFPGAKVYVFSDDFEYCELNFKGSRFYFMSGLNDIEQLAALSSFEYFVLSNSTFSFWGPLLAGSPKLVLYPESMFSDPEMCQVFNKDFWPDQNCYQKYPNPKNKPYAKMSGLYRETNKAAPSFP